MLMRAAASTAIGGLLILSLLGLGAAWMAGSAMTRGQGARVAPPLPPGRDIRLTSQDGLTIAGTFTPGTQPHAPAVLLLHGVGASRQAVAANAAWLARQGYATLAIDFRGHGQSDLATRTFGLNEAQDAQAALDWLKRQQGDAKVAVIGISLGGAATLIGARGPLDADALILQAVYPDIRRAIRNRIASRVSKAAAYLLEPLLSYQAPLRFGVLPARLSPQAALRRYPGPVLVIGGMEDRSTPPQESRAMFAAVQGRKELWLLPQGDHAEICALSGPAYRETIAAFLSRTIGRP